MRKDMSLRGKLLVAMPGMSDPRFDRSVIFVCAHSDSGAMGVIVNKAAPMMYFADLVEKLDIAPEGGPSKIAADIMRKPVLFGGPVEQFRGFVLHSADYHTPETSPQLSDGIALTATLDVLRDIALGHGPSRAILMLGYAGWTAGQLDDEIQRNGWLHCDTDSDLVFAEDILVKYGRAMAKIGIDPRMLSADVGHA
jgi:putative transcriptional regulator